MPLKDQLKDFLENRVMHDLTSVFVLMIVVGM